MHSAVTNPTILQYYHAESTLQYFEDGKLVRFTAVMSGKENKMLIFNYGITVAERPVIEE